MSMPSAVLDDLDSRIAACLQVNGRVTWRKIAEVLREPERTVVRRGSQLLASRAVVVTALGLHGESVLIRASCAPGTARITARSIANSDDTTFSYVVTGVDDCVAEITVPPAELSRLLLEELPSVSGMLACSALPVLRYYRTIDQWHPGLLSAEQIRALAPPERPPTRPGTMAPARSSVEFKLRAALQEDGRATVEELARLAGVSEPTVRRRLEVLRADGHLEIRAVVEPASLRLPVEALLWIRTAPQHVDRVGKALAERIEVRYAAAVMGTHQLVVNVAVRDKEQLHSFLTHGPWQQHVLDVESSLVVTSLKRGGILARAS